MCPTWFFVDSLKRGVRENVRFLHCFHSRDEAVEISRQRRGLDYPVPGNGAVLPNRPGVTVLDCSRCAATLGNHDYGRVDFACVLEQGAFFEGARPEDRKPRSRTRGRGVGAAGGGSSVSVCVCV